MNKDCNKKILKMADIQEGKFRLFMFSKGDRKHDMGGFSNFMKHLMEYIVKSNGWLEDYKAGRLKKITLFIHCDYKGEEGSLVTKQTVDKNLVYAYHIDFDKIVELDFNLEYFGDLINAIVRIVLFDYGIDSQMISKICKKNRRNEN